MSMSCFSTAIINRVFKQLTNAISSSRQRGAKIVVADDFGIYVWDSQLLGMTGSM